MLNLYVYYASDKSDKIKFGELDKSEFLVRIKLWCGDLIVYRIHVLRGSISSNGPSWVEMGGKKWAAGMQGCKQPEAI